MRHVAVNGARLWAEEAGSGPAVVLVHGGLGDHRLWDGQFDAFAERFRTIRYDLRWFGRSEAPAEPFSHVDDLRALLDALEVPRAALVGLSYGGRIAIDCALAHPERVWALVPVCSALSGFSFDPYTPEQDAAFESGDPERAMAADLEVWAPLGADERLRELWRATPDASPPPEGAEPDPGGDARRRLAELDVPTLVVTATRDVHAMDEIGDLLEHGIRGARRVRLDSDHYLPLREPAAFDDAVLGFLASVA